MKKLAKSNSFNQVEAYKTCNCECGCYCTCGSITHHIPEASNSSNAMDSTTATTETNDAKK